MSTSANTMQCHKCGREILGSMIQIDCFLYHPSCYFAADKDAEIAALKAEVVSLKTRAEALEKKVGDAREFIDKCCFCVGVQDRLKRILGAKEGEG